MTINGWIQIALYCVILTLLVKPFGGYMTCVFNGERTLLSPVLRPVERGFYAISGVDERAEQHWVTYGIAMLVFTLAGFVSLYALQRLQAVLPFNPQGQAAVSPDLAFNTSVSFITNTNWQSYTPESAMSYLTQMAGLTVHNFVSAATGIALAIALIRGFARRSAKTVGNFWVDMTRCVLYVLLPISIVVGLFFVWQGMPQNLGAYTEATTLEGAKQVIAQGPVASQEVIKMFGTNGGGFFNANSAHPFENPNALTNFVQILLIFSIGAALTNVFGRMVGSQRHGWAIFAVMGLLFLAGVCTAYPVEAGGNPTFAALHVNSAPSTLQAGGNMEGKEVRFGIADSALFATVTTDASCGAVNTMHDSLLPLAGMVPMINMMLGEIIFGGVGSGLYGMLLFAIVAVFVAGLMVGRTPEYLGKKIEAKEVKMAMLAILILPLSMLGFTAIAVVVKPGLDGLANAGPHGFSEALYAYVSATGNNGSAFAGLSANTPFWNTTLGLAMWIGRFLFIVPMLAVAGSLAAKKIVPASAGTFPTDGGLFVGLLVGVILIVGGLTFFPALALGPITEHLAMQSGTLF
jgi:K+-transporting ATPase ATPase A chain